MEMSHSLVPHAVCWKGDPALIWTMVITNAITFLSYLAICATLLYLARCTHRVLARDWAFFVTGFALFIVACGSTHLLDVVTTWIPIFWVDASANILAALLSAYVAVQFFRRVHLLSHGINDYAARLANTEQERARLETSLLSAQKLEDWSRVSAAVSHEIANPLESIQNLLYLIRNTDGTPAEAIAYANTAAAEAERTLTIARSALDFLRQSPSPVPVNLLDAANSVGTLLDRMLRTLQIDLQITTSAVADADPANLIVEARPGEARQVLLNLVRNAAEASPKGGSRICVSLVSKPAAVEVTGADQGSGLDPAILPVLFEFGASTKGAQGNGMGLWSVKHILTRHGGSVYVTSEPGQGTSFVFTWPRSSPEVSPAPARISKPSAPAVSTPSPRAETSTLLPQ